MQKHYWKVTALSILFCLLCCFACERSTQPLPDDFVVKVRLAAEPDKLSPLLTLNGYSSQVQENVFMTLEQFDPVTLGLQPLLITMAPEFEVIKKGAFQGGIAYTFEILKEASWDNGQPVLASDYIFTLKAMLNPEVAAAPYRSYFDFLGDVIVDDSNPGRFTVLTTKAYMLAEAALSSIPIYPEYHFDPEGLLRDFSIGDLQNEVTKEQKERLHQFADTFQNTFHTSDPKGVVGCGPYALVEWQSGQQIILKKKTNWWGDTLAEKQPSLAANPVEIQYKIIPDNTAAITALKNGQVDVVSEIKPLSFVELKQTDYVTGKINLYTPPYLAYYYMAINGKKPYLKDLSVRRALAHLTDVDQVIETLLFSLGEKVTGPIHPSKSFYNNKLTPIPYDLAKARQLLKEADWKDTDADGILDKIISGKKEKLALTFIYSVSNEMGEGLGLLLQEAAKKVGIGIHIKGMEFREAIKAYRGRDYDLAFFRWSNLPGPDDLKQIWHTSSDTPDGGNRTGFGDSSSDALIDSIRITLDEEKRKDLYLRIQERIYTDQPYIFLFAPLERIAVNKRFDAITSAQRPGFFPRQFTLSKKQVNH